MKQAWNAEGSPFKGQPFDPSLINFTGSQFNPNPWLIIDKRSELTNYKFLLKVCSVIL